MTEVSDSVTVEAPVEPVFAFMDDPENHVAVTPNLAAVRNVERREDGRKRLDYTFRMAGVDLEGELVEVERTENEHMRFEMCGQLDGEIELAFDATDGGTELAYTARFDVPGRVLSTVAEPAVRRFNERELSRTLANVKRHFGDESEAEGHGEQRGKGG